MRKIIITFIISVILVISGAFVFMMEVSRIDYHKVQIESQKESYQTTIADQDDSITIDVYPTNYSGYSNIELIVDSMHMDPALNENEIAIDYPNLFEIHQNGQVDGFSDTIFTFTYALKTDTNIFAQCDSWDDLVHIWHSKEVDIPSLDKDSLKLQIRYGKNLENRIHMNNSFVG